MSRDDVIQYIKNAFAGVGLSGGLTLAQAQAIDNCSFSDFDGTRLSEWQTDLGKKWEEVTTEELEQYPVLAHLDSLGFRFYLPAVMCSLLLHPNARSNRFYQAIVLLNPIAGEDREVLYSQLSLSQKRAVALFLGCLPAIMTLRDECIREIESMLSEYWSDYLYSDGS